MQVPAEVRGIESWSWDTVSYMLLEERAGMQILQEQYVSLTTETSVQLPRTGQFLKQVDKSW